MGYRLYIGFVQTEAEYRALKANWMPRRYNELDDALGYAARVIELGQEIPWEIVGDDGSVLSRSEIHEIVRRRRHELRDRPKVY